MNENIIDLKKNLRKEIKNRKKQISDEIRRIKSLELMNKLAENPFFKKAETIFIFWSMNDEIDTRDFIIKWSGKKRFVLPAINGDELHLKEFTGVHKLINGDLYSIPEPDGIPFSDFNAIDLAVVPGIAFDKNNNRLGRGKAYYDKILSKLKGKAHLIGICYDFQIVEKVPAEPHDIKMDGVIYA